MEPNGGLERVRAHGDLAVAGRTSGRRLRDRRPASTGELLQPDRFDPQRRGRQAYTFGFGVHACPGEALATAIAEVGVAHLLAAGVEPERLVERVTYRPSANTRIPLFGGAA